MFNSSGTNTLPLPRRFRSEGALARSAFRYLVISLSHYVAFSFPSASYLCAACTCGQAISTASVREDVSSPVEI